MSDSTQTVIERFNEAFNRHDVDAIMNGMTDDCVFENTRPAPDGTRITGQAAVRRRHTSTRRRRLPPAIDASSGGATRGSATERRDTSAAWTSFVCGTVRSPRSSLT